MADGRKTWRQTNSSLLLRRPAARFRPNVANPLELKSPVMLQNYSTHGRHVFLEKQKKLLTKPFIIRWKPYTEKGKHSTRGGITGFRWDGMISLAVIRIRLAARCQSSFLSSPLPTPNYFSLGRSTLISIPTCDEMTKFLEHPSHRLAWEHS